MNFVIYCIAELHPPKPPFNLLCQEERSASRSLGPVLFVPGVASPAVSALLQHRVQRLEAWKHYDWPQGIHQGELSLYDPTEIRYVSPHLSIDKTFKSCSSNSVQVINGATDNRPWIDKAYLLHVQGTKLCVYFHSQYSLWNRQKWAVHLLVCHFNFLSM